MKFVKTAIAAVVLASTAFSAFAADMDASQARAAYQHADRMASSTAASAVHTGYGDDGAYNGHGWGAAVKQESATASAFAAERAQAAADMRSTEAAAVRSAAAVAGTPAAPKAPSVSMNVPNAPAQKNVPQSAPTAQPQQAPSITGTSYRAAVTTQQTAALAAKEPSLPADKPAAPTQPTAIVDKPTNSAINVDAGSLPKNAPVQTAAGVVTAGSLPADTQVSMPIDSVFSAPARKGGHDHSSSSHSEHGTGNGGSNAQGSRSAGGFSTRGEHIGGGAVGGGFHY